MSTWGGEATQNAILSTITSSPPGWPQAKVNRIVFSYNSDGSINTIQFSDVNNNLLFTLTFGYSAGSIVSITRS
ncbi:MAG: hypothetical protein ABSD73_09135 [Candidatus Bathyarchaeia archaeon]|jgi:hypothetical protein